nr:uncharacterized protein LOC129272068 [Lytechinus pictus]
MSVIEQHFRDRRRSRPISWYKNLSLQNQTYSFIYFFLQEDCASFLENNSLAVIDFFADWCGPCKMIAPKVKDLALAFASVKFGKVNVDDAEEVAQKYDVSAMPTFILFKDGQKFDTIVGANEAKLKEGVEKLVK